MNTQHSHMKLRPFQPRLHPIAAAALAALAALAMPATAGTITGTPHDLSTKGWGTTELCKFCHTPHQAQNVVGAPLWNHRTTTANYSLYSSATFKGSSTQPGPTSKLCLSCHDGTVAINQSLSGTISGGTPDYIDDGAKISNDLHVTHPISFDYTDALATTDGGLEKPSTYTIGDPKTGLTVTTAPVPAAWDGTSLTGKTIKEALLEGDRMQCSSCHDVHKLVGSAPSSGIMVKISGSDTGSPTRGSLICRTCHIK